MEINCIFAVVNRSLYAVQFAGEQSDVFTDIFDKWNDIEYLEDFFERNKEDLQNGYYGSISIEEAIQITLEEAERLESYIVKVARANESSRRDQKLDFMFNDLNKTDYSVQLVKSKTYGLNKPSWLRLYAKRIAENLYIITGGAIKLTKTMN